MGSKNNPGKFDCYANAEPDEPMFVLLARDRHAPTLVWLWSTLRELDQEDPAKVAEARNCLEAMLEWQAARGRRSVGLGQSALAGVVELIRTVNGCIASASNAPTEVEEVRRFLAATTFEKAVPDGSQRSELSAESKELVALREVATWAQALLTALNVNDVHSGSSLHKKLREVMINYRNQTGAPGAVCWLIERGSAAGHSPTIWWCGGDRRANVGEDEIENWTQNALAARRFSTRDEAEMLAKRLLGEGSYIVTEHIYLGDVMMKASG